MSKFNEFKIKIKKIFSKKEKSLENKTRLNILGISYTKKDEQVIYIIILGEENGDMRKIPIIVNYNEAQSVAVETEKITPIVPFVHDTIKEIITNHKIKYDEILITDFKNDILKTFLINKKEKIEIKTVDALSLSIRMGYPIYILNDTFFEVNKMVQKLYDIKDGKKFNDIKDDIEDLTIEDLNDLLQEAIDDEEYEQASIIRDEIIKKKDNAKYDEN